MNTSRLTIILALTVFLVSSISYGRDPNLDYETTIEHSPRNIKMQPDTLDEAVAEIRRMVEDKRPKWEIAERVTTIADLQITDMNTDEAPWSKRWVWDPFSKLTDREIKAGSPWLSEEETEFRKWRDEKSGGNATYDKAAEWVWQSRVGQCCEGARLMYYLLVKAGIENVRIFSQENPNHGFVVWGMDEEADPENPESWTDAVVVLDNWQHKVFRGDQALKSERIRGEGENKKIKDSTSLYDPKTKIRCGFPPDGAKPASCCKKTAPCRNNPNLVCLNDVCVYCGGKDKPCCEGKKCKHDDLECYKGGCIQRSKGKLDRSWICPIPAPMEATKVILLYEEAWTMPNKMTVGPYGEWYDEQKTKKKLLCCSDTEGLPHGPCHNWYKDGRMKSALNYKHGEEHGQFSYWYKENFQLEREINFKEGEYHGAYKIYTLSGNRIVDNLYESGVLRRETLFYPDGSKKHSREGILKGSGVDTGSMTRFFRTEEKEKSYEEYKDEKKDGQWRKWRKKPYSLESIATYVNGKRHGSHTTYFKNSALKTEEEYVDDRLVKRVIYGFDGKPSFFAQGTFSGHRIETGTVTKRNPYSGFVVTEVWEKGKLVKRTEKIGK